MGGSRPLGAGKGPIRSQMDSSYPLRDRMAARRADKALTAAPADDGGMMQPPASRLDASPTPGLDAQPRTPITYGTKQGRMAEQGAARMKSSMSGAFGERAKAKTVRDVNATVSKFRDQGLAMMGRGTGPAMATKTASVTGVPVATPPAAPLQGRALAKRNIATKGFQGAAADYFKRRDNEMLAKQSKGLDTAMAKPQAYQGNPAAKPTRAGVTAPAASGSVNPIRSQYPEALSPTMGIATQPKPAAVAQSDAEDDYGKANMNWTPRDNRQNARDAVAAAEAKGSIPSYQDRKQAGFVSGSELVAPVAKKATQIGQAAKTIGKDIGTATRKGVQAARNFSEKTNNWSADFRSGRKGAAQTASIPKSRFRR